MTAPWEGAFPCGGKTKASLLEGRWRGAAVTEGVSRKGARPDVIAISGKLIPRAKELRKGATKQENHLWYDFLRSYPCGFSVRKRLMALLRISIVTLQGWSWKWTGSQHYDEQGLAYDKERSAIFAEYGVKVIRFSNLEIEQSFQEVCSAIDLEVRKRVQELEDTPSVKA